MKKQALLNDVIALLPATSQFKLNVNVSRKLIISWFGIEYKYEYRSATLTIYSHDLFNYLITELATKPTGNKLYIKKLKLTINLSE